MARHRLPEDVPPARVSSATVRQAAHLAGYLWPYRRRFIAAFAALAGSSSLALTLPFLAGRLVDCAVAGREEEAVPWPGSVNAVAGVLVGVLALQAACSFLQSYWFNEVGARGLTDLRRDTFGRLVRLPLSFFSGRRVGELASRLASDLGQIQEALSFAAPHFLRQVAMLAGGVVLLVLTSWRLTLVLLASFPLLIGIAVGFGRHIRRLSREAQDRLADSAVVVDESLQGIATVKAFTNEPREEVRYGQAVLAVLAASLRGARSRGVFVSFIVFGLFGGIVLVLWYGSRLVQAGELSVGELTRFMLYAMLAGGAMGSFAEFYSQLQRTLGATQRVRELLEEKPESLAGGPGVAGRTGRRLRGELAFERVRFRYPSRPEVAVLRELSLAARPGERIALVGPSGAGKSTVVALLLRFYEPESGRVLVDGRDARDFPLAEYRGGLAVVPQDVFLFGGSIADNIAYGRPGATEEDVVEAGRLANADGFIRAFPDGYATLVGERGVQLSGGQRQRIAIARAILRDPAILVLDEATSSLDSESERLVQQALERLMEGRTSLVIAHRLATVRRADRIYVLKEGQVVESGTHAELSNQEGGLYRMLSELQLDRSDDRDAASVPGRG